MGRMSLTITCAILLACLIWMDVCLYYQIQRMPEESDTTVSFNHSSNDNQSTFDLMNKFSFAFQGMSVKLMMTDPVDNYLLAPLSEALVDMANFKENFLFITPNIVSYAGVVSALIAAKLVSYNSSTLHKLSYVMFQLRTWLDDLDGAVARSRLGIHKHVSLQSTSGYVVDGVCDGIGFIAYVIGCYFFMKKTLSRRQRSGANEKYNLQSITEVKSNSPSTYIALQQAYDDRECLANQETLHENDGDDDFNPATDDDEDDEEIHHFGAPGDKLQSKNLIYDPKANSRRNQVFSRSRVYLEKIQRGKQSSIIFYRYIERKLKKNLDNKKLALVTLCFLLQMAMCATFWNRYILVYRDLLESPSSDPIQARAKTKILKSNIMYIIIWFWRITNGHSMMQMLIASVFIGKLWQYLNFIKYIGFVEIILLATITELHIIDIRNYLHA